jgi:hypothetical protein
MALKIIDSLHKFNYFFVFGGGFFEGDKGKGKNIASRWDAKEKI